jgi:hypothetical protein
MIELPYKRIISYGCSITAGSELIDHELLNLSEEDLFAHVKKQNIRGPRDLFESLNASPKTIENIRVRNATKSWPNFIAKRFNKPMHNRAMAGTSLSDATYRILSDIHNSKINDDDLILVGVTSPLRWFQFFETGDFGGGIFGSKFTGSVWELKFSNEFKTQIEHHWVNAYNIVYTHFKELMVLSALSDRLGGRLKLCYVFGKDTFVSYTFSEELKKKNFSKFFDMCVSTMPTHNEINPTALTVLSGSPTTDVENHHVFGHPRIEYHEQYANLVIEKLEQMYSD